VTQPGLADQVKAVPLRGTRPWMRQPRVEHAAAAPLYIAISLLVFGRDAIANPNSVCACAGPCGFTR
jgi:hypothetical protein